MKNKILFLISLITLIATPAYAVGVKSATIIANPTANLSMTFQSTAGTTFDAPAAATTLSNMVNPVYGLKKLSEATFNITTAGVSTNFFTVTLNNLSNHPSTPFEANTSGGFTSVAGNPGTLANWIIAFDNNTVIGIANDADFKFKAQIKPAANARSSSRAQIITEYSLGNSLTGDAYVGYDEIDYGGADSVTATFLTQINGPDMVVVSRTSTTNAPAGFSGNANASVPGAKISMQIILKNQGLVSANNLNIVDRIPVKTTLFDKGTLENNGVPVNFYCATQSSSPYTFVGCNTVASGNVTAVQFNVGTVSPNNFVTLNYSVTID